jgi:hypothetical protein
LSPWPPNPGEERRYPHDTPLTTLWYPSDMPCLGMNFDHAVATKNDVTHFSRHRRIWCWPMLLLAGLRVSHHVGALSWEVLKLSSKLLRLLVPTKQGWIQLIEPARMEGTSRKIGRLGDEHRLRFVVRRFFKILTWILNFGSIPCLRCA